MAPKNTKSIIQFVVLLGIGVLLIWLLLRQVEPEKDKIIDAFRTANYFWVFVSMVIAFGAHFFRALRWNYLLNPAGHRVKLLNSVCHVLVGYLANYGLPRMGEVSRCTLAAKYDKVPFEIGFGTVITERIVDFILLLVVFILTLLLQFQELYGLADKYLFSKLSEKFSGLGQSPVKIAVMVIVALALIGSFFLLRKKFSGLLKGKLGKVIRGMIEGIGSIRKMDKPFRFVFLSLLIWLCYFYSLYVCFFALSGTSALGQKECLTLLLFGTFGVIFTPGGIGAYQAIVGGILLYFHIDTATAFSLPWLSWTAQLILVAVLGIVSLIILPVYNREKHAVS